MSQKYLGLITIIITLSITSCGSVQKASNTDNFYAKSFKIEKGKSNIYLYRDQLDSFETVISAEIDGQHVSDTEQRTFIFKTLNPGKHTITAHAENTSSIELNTEPDKNYFIWMEVTLGLNNPRAKLHEVNEHQGKAGVKNSVLVN